MSHTNKKDESTLNILKLENDNLKTTIEEQKHKLQQNNDSINELKLENTG
jgi:hypothetical protein